MNKPFLTKLLRRCGIAVLSLLTAGALWLPPITAAADDESIHRLGNGFVDVYVDESSGRFAIMTDEGNPNRREDSNQALLFGGTEPKTSFATFRINGEDYIYGNSYGFLGLESGFAQAPISAGLANQAVWEIQDLHITQTIQLVSDPSNPNVGNVRIAYQVNNQSDETVQIGGRMLLDTMLGATDAAPITLEGDNRFIQNETEIRADLPQYWRAVDDPLAPEVISYGFLSGWNNLEPSRLIIGHWEGLSASKWDYTPDENLYYTSDKNPYGSADSALAIYWEPAGLAPGQSRVYETYYGLGSFERDGRAADYSTLLTGPRALEIHADRDGYEPASFDVHLAIDNTYSDAEKLEEVTVELGLPEELQLADGEQAVQKIDEVAVNGTRTITWRVEAKPQSMYTAARYWASVQAKGGEAVRKAAFVILPATTGAIPDVQVLDLLPNKKYTGDATHELLVTGKGFDALMGDTSIEVTLTRELDGQVFIVPYASLSVTSNYMNIRLDEVWSEPVHPGEYTLHIDAGEHGEFEQRMMYTEDESYRSRQYGVIAVTSGGEHHQIIALESEQELDTITDEKLIVIRGDIHEIADPSGPIYEVQPGATMNNVVRFHESDLAADLYAENQRLTIQKRDGTVTLRGVGALSIPSFPFAVGAFTMKLDDGTDYALDPDESNDEAGLMIDWPLMSWSGSELNLDSLPVKITNARLGENTVSFGGKLRLHLGTAKDDAADADTGGTGGSSDSGSVGSGGTGEVDETGGPPSSAGITVEMQEARFGTTDDGQFGLVGIHAQGEVKMPEAFIPGMTFAADGRVLINTFDKIYEIEVGVSFEVVEANGLISLRFTDENIPIVDTLEFAVGAKPGIPLVPPTVVGYVTKAGGGFHHLYDTIMGNYQVLPPLKLVLMGDMELAKIVEASNLRLEMSLQETSFSGDFKIASVPILNGVYGTIRVADTTDYLGVDVNIGAKITVLEIINGDIGAVFSYDSSRNGIFGPIYLAGNGSVAIVIPEDIPLIGNTTLASVETEISTEKLYARAAILEVPLAITYEWGGDVKLGHTGAVSILSHNSRIMGLGEQKLVNPETGEYMGRLTFGSNLRRGMSSVATSRASRGDIVRILGAGTPQSVVVPSDQDYALFELLLEDQGRTLADILAQLEVNAPDGVYSLVEGTNVQLNEAGDHQQRLIISAQDPAAGTWTFTYDQEMNVTPYYATELPGFDEAHGIQWTRHDDEIEVTWLAQHADGMKIALYVTEDPSSDAGQLVLAPGDVAAGAGHASFTLPEHLASGTYYVKVVLVDGETNVHSMSSTAGITIVNPNEPDAPLSPTASSIGNGFVQVDWTYDEAELPDGYAIQALDAEGNPISGVGAIYVDSEARTANIGGVYTNIYTHPETGDTIEEASGLLPGHRYRFNVQAYNLVGDTKVFSSSSLTDPVAVAVPNPATISLQVAEDQAVVSDEAGTKVYWTRQDRVDMQINSDQPIDAFVYRNGVLAGDGSGTSWSQSIELPEDGSSHIEVVAQNALGDMTVSAIQIRRDTTAPDLKIEAPTIQQIATGSADVRGSAEPGSTVTVNGEEIVLQSDGRFSTTVPLDGYMTRIITVVAEDQAGNRSTYTAEVLNSESLHIERVEIRPASDTSAIDETITNPDEWVISAGQDQALLLAGITDEHETFTIDADHVEWDILLGEEYGDVSAAGQLQTTAEGEMVILARYAVSSEYALEDAIIVQVKSEADDPDPEPEPDPGTDPEPDPGPNPGDSDTGSIPSGGLAPDIDAQLRAILEQIIRAAGNLELIGIEQLSEDQDNIIELGDRAAITIFQQEGLDEYAIGLGRVTNPEQYVPASGMLQLIGDIYELKLNQPFDFEQLPVLTIQVDEEWTQVDHLDIYWYNEQLERWEYIGGAYDAEQHTVSARLPHFSKYALLYHPERRSFTDMTGRWSEDIVYRLHSIGVIDGVFQHGQWVYEPTRSISREAFIKLLVAASETQVVNVDIPAHYVDLDDVGTWAVPYLATAIRQQWLAGVHENGEWRLNPKHSITRAEAAVLIHRLLGDQLPVSSDTAISYTDEHQIPSWAITAIRSLSDSGIIHGYPDGSFEPYQTLTREEAATLILNLLVWQYTYVDNDL